MKGFSKLIKSFGYAFSGIFTCIKSCRNFRIHTVAVIVVLYFSRYYGFSDVGYALIFLTFGLVLTAEALNCALEFTCNAVTEEKNDKIKLAKDAAAGAVLVSAFCAIAVAGSLFLKPKVISHIFLDFAASPLKILCLSVFALISILYIFYEDIFKNGKK